MAISYNSKVRLKRRNKILNAIKSQVFLLAMVIVVLIVLASVINPRFLTINNIKNILMQISIIAIMALGAGLVIISGSLDISVGSMVSLLAVVGANLMAGGNSVPVAIFSTIGVAIVCGLVNGILAAKTKVAPFIITLGTMSIFTGFSYIISRGSTALIRGKFEFLGRGRILGVHVPVYVMIVTYIIIFLILRYTRFGRRIFGIGGAEEVAYLAGVNIPIYKILIYSINALLVCLATLILISRTGSALSTVGIGLELKAIAATIIGGTSLTGGKGSVFGIFLGALLLGVIQNVINILNLSSHYQSVVIGIVIVIAVTIGQKQR